MNTSTSVWRKPKTHREYRLATDEVQFSRHPVYGLQVSFSIGPPHKTTNIKVSIARKDYPKLLRLIAEGLEPPKRGIHLP